MITNTHLSRIFKTITCLLFGTVLMLVANSTLAKDYNIGLSMHFMRDDYTVRFAETVKQVVEQHPNAKLVITDANAMPQKQLADMENLVVQGMDAIIVIPIDEKAILPVIKKANASNIPVFAVTKIPNANVVTTIGANGEYEYGRISAELLVKATGGKGKLAVINAPFSLWRLDERERGFYDVIRNTELKVVVTQSGLEQAKVQDTVSGILIAHPDLNGIWCTFSNQIVGAADALRMARRKDIVLTGVDADKAIIQRIKSGWVSGAAAQYPAEHGRLAAEAVFKYLAGEPVEENYAVPADAVTLENVDEMDRKIWGN